MCVIFQYDNYTDLVLVLDFGRAFKIMGKTAARVRELSGDFSIYCTKLYVVEIGNLVPVIRAHLEFGVST